MERHSLIKRQIKKYLSTELQESPALQQFLDAINTSYVNFERDKELSDHAYLLSHTEFTEINQKLRQEIQQRKTSVYKLKETIKSMENELELPDSFDENDLVSLVNYLEAQVDYRNKVERDLITAKETAEKATYAKSEFLSMMSHEIRTPLNAVIGMSYLLLQEDPKPSQISYLKTLQFSAENLLVIINDILDFSKIEAGKIELEKIDFNFRQLIQNIKAANQVRADERNNRLKVMIDEDLPTLLIGDPMRLSQVLNNLISNAIKFTQNGSVTIDIRLDKKENNIAYLDFKIVDTGIGISPENQVIIFEKFNQAASDTTRKYGGTGLGLSITQKLLELHGSQIQLESTLGKGSTFSFSLVLPIANPMKEFHSTPTPEGEKNLKGIKILVVEDNPVNVFVAERFLGRWNAVVEVAENGFEAVEKVAKNEYDIVLMDLQMPEKDGYMATSEIREFNKEIPIIALTASVMLDIKDRAFEVGMTDFVTKPFNPNELYGKIHRYAKVSS